MPVPDKTWLFVVDLDKTLWNSEDISSLKPPFRRVGEYVFEDSRGIKVEVYKDIVDALKWARENGAVIAVISWNREDIAIEALRACGVLQFLDFYVIEDHPRKDSMFSRLVETLKTRGLERVVDCTVYIDDSEVFLKQVLKVAPYTCTLKAWRDFIDKNTFLERLQDCLRKCGKVGSAGEVFCTSGLHQ